MSEPRLDYHHYDRLAVLPGNSVEVKLDHVLAARVVHGFAGLVLRVDNAGDELFAKAALVSRADGQRGHEGTVRHDRLERAGRKQDGDEMEAEVKRDSGRKYQKNSAQWVDTVCRRRIHFIQKTFP